MKQTFAHIFGHQTGTGPQNRGQVLLEVLIAVAAVATISATIATLIIVAQRGQENAKRRDAAANIAAEVFTAITAMANSDIPNVTQGYNRIYCPPDGVCGGTYPETNGKNPADTDHHYHPVLVGNHFELAAGELTEELAGFDFTHYTTVENVCRDALGDIAGTWVDPTIEDCASWYGAGSLDDPFTQKVTATFQSPQIPDIVFSKFITRSRSTVETQASWSGAIVADGAGVGVIEFSIPWTNDDDDDGDVDDPVKVFLCRSSAQPLSLDCPAGSWTETSSFTTTSPAVLYYAPGPADVGTNEFWVYVCDTVGQCQNSDNGGSPDTWNNYGTFIVN